MTKTVWRPYPFANHIATEQSREARVLAKLERNGGTLTRKEAASLLGLADSGQIETILLRAGLKKIGQRKNVRGRLTGVYGRSEGSCAQTV